MGILVLLSGPIAVGKTSTGGLLIESHGFVQLKSSDYLKRLCRERGIAQSRTSLQELGDGLDELTDYAWLVRDVAQPQMNARKDHRLWLIDSVRKRRQIEHFKDAFGSKALHVHLWAPDDELRRRYEERRRTAAHAEGDTPYEQAIGHANEVASRALKPIADLALNLGAVSPETAAAAISGAVKAIR